MRLSCMFMPKIRQLWYILLFRLMLWNKKQLKLALFHLFLCSNHYFSSKCLYQIWAKYVLYIQILGFHWNLFRTSEYSILWIKIFNLNNWTCLTGYTNWLELCEYWSICSIYVYKSLYDMQWSVRYWPLS